MMRRVPELLASDHAIQVLVALFVLLGALYSVTTPIFEAGDELWHYPHVQWIARGNGLPVQDPAHDQLWEQEGGQPPLFYVTSAALTFWIDTSDMEARLWRNHDAKIGIPLAFGNKNMVVHTPAENFPWQGTTLAVHLIRFLSVLFSAGTVFLTYKIVREILSHSFAPSLPLSISPSLPPSLALLSAALVAFNPMFLFISASVNNDALAALLATVAIYLTIQLITRGVTYRRVLVLGIVIGFAILAKVSNLALGGVAGIVILDCTRQNLKSNFTQFDRIAKRESPLSGNSSKRDFPQFPYFPLLPFFRQLVISAFLLGFPVLLISGWWFARNYFLYGDPLAFNVWMQIAGGRPPQTVLGLLDEFQGFRISYWGNFGGVNIIAPEWVYTVLDLATVVGVLGLVLGALRRNLSPLLWVLVLHFALVFVALIRWTLMTYASQGRLIFPAIASVSILLTFGLYEMGTCVSLLVSRFSTSASRALTDAPRTLPLILPALAVLFLFAFAIATPFAIIAPVYAQPARIANEASVPNPVHITFDAGDAQPELVGFDAPRFVEGNELPLRLYWRTAAPVHDDLKMYVHVYDVKGESLGQWDAYPGNGLYPPQLWQPNEIFADEYRIPLQSPSAYPPIGRIEVGMTRVGDTNVLPAHNPQGDTITPSIARFKFVQPPGAPAAPRLTFADQFNLLDIHTSAQRGGQEIAFDTDAGQSITLQPGDLLTVQVVLQARGIPDADFTLFAHLADAGGKIVAQRDAQPLDNSYPTTLLDKNEQVTDTLQMQIPPDVPAGNYILEFGVYRAADLQRLPVNGNAWGVWRVEGDHVVAGVEVGR